MPVALTDRDRRLLDGERGEGARLAMRIVVRMAEVMGAAELMDVTQAHIDGCGLLTGASLEFAETLAAGGACVAVPTTLNMGPLDLEHWREFGIDEAFAAKAIRQADAYEAMGCIPTWTCAPYQGYLTPRFGQQIAWGESNAVVYANSVLGARTNRYGDYIDICAAITGRVPRCGLHLSANRHGQVLVRLVGFEPGRLRDPVFYPVLGHLLGPLAGDRVPVLEGLPRDASDDQLKALGAAVASSGAVALFHAVGLTPEAPTREAAFGGREPEADVEIGPSDWAAALADLSSADEGATLDVVVLGCPHFSFAEFRQLAEAIEAVGGRTVHPGVELIVITSRQAHALARSVGLLETLAAFGAKVTLDTCVFHTPLVRPEAQVLMTNSGKCAYYAPGELGVRVAFGGLADCVRSAVEGQVSREGWTGKGRREPRATAPQPAARSRDGAAGPWQGRAVVPGAASGVALVSREPISLWGGLDAATGRIIDERHDRCGEVVTGRVFVFPHGKGSSTASGILLETIRLGTAPAAIVTARVSPILALGSIVADELFGEAVPIVVLPDDAFAAIADGERVTIEADGTVIAGS